MTIGDFLKWFVMGIVKVYAAIIVLALISSVIMRFSEASPVRRDITHEYSHR